MVLRDSLLPTNAVVEEMMAELHRVYSAKVKLTGYLMSRVNWLMH